MNITRTIGSCFLVIISLANIACTSIAIKEQSFLRDKQQSILYYLARHGESNEADISNATLYSMDTIAKTLSKLHEKDLVIQSGNEWTLSAKYKSDEQEYVEAIKQFDLTSLQKNLPAHKVSIFTLPDSTIHGASFIAPHATETLVMFPGNGFNLIPDVLEVKKLLASNRNVFVMEYPGMGDSKGELTVETLKTSAQQFTSYVKAHPAVSGTSVTLYGFSLGGFVATHIASGNAVDALILDSTAPDMQRWIDANVPVYAKAFVDINVENNLASVSNIAAIKEMTLPMLFIAGELDNITPPQLVKEIYNAASLARFKEFTILDKVQHGESVDNERFQPILTAFITKATSPESQEHN